MRRTAWLLTLVVVTLAWNAALASAPTTRAPRLAAITYAAGSLICHQRADRSFRREGAQYPVCARCLGLYAGALAGVLLWSGVGGWGTRLRPRAARVIRPAVVKGTLMVAALPTMVSVAASWLGWWDATNVLRAAMALPLGAVIAMVITAVAAGDLR